MKKRYAKISNKIRLVGISRMRGSEEVVDYYLVHPVYGREYAFTRKYTRATYDILILLKLRDFYREFSLDWTILKPFYSMRMGICIMTNQMMVQWMRLMN